MPLSNCVPFVWYIVVICEHCGTRQPLFRDLSNGKAKLIAIYKHRCMKCQHVGHYDCDGGNVERYQHIVERRQKPR